jgi:class 3 adenylate cyclase
MIDKKPTMANRINKTSICSILFLDMVDYSKKSDADQIEIKNQLNDLISLSLGSVAKDDRIILDSGDGVAIAYMGSPEDLMFVALTIRDGILKGNLHSQNPLFVRFGINLGPVRIVSDINGRPNIIGDGINVAQRIMSFSEPNQILVSRSFYEITSRLTVEFSEMFAYSGIKQDKHVRDHEVYYVRSHSNQVASTGQPNAPKDERRSSDKINIKNKHYWLYGIPSLLILSAVFAIARFSSAPSDPMINTVKAMPSAEIPSQDTLKPNEAVKNISSDDLKSLSDNKLVTTPKETLHKKNVSSKSGALMQKNVLHEKVVANKANQDAKHEMESRRQAERLPIHAENPKSPKVEDKAVDRPVKIAKKSAENDKTKEKSFFKSFTDSVQRGSEVKCNQGQIVLGQCN